ncbi:MAG TPA: hypothetical protein VLA61_16270 [Ideonella sp.]|uniref:hypothetical protein n=1 Tax=Ideonella sp. TaxID=1929293 RepID=UPI002BEC62F4|nr:hypothetical protein [Ideonella sp.]HSI49828.1 hypothetical protein [Ideonella sp.]
MTHRTIAVTHWKQGNKTVNQFTGWRRSPPTVRAASRRPPGWVELRRGLGLNPGARLEVTEEADGLRLRVQRAVPQSAVSELAGMVTAPSRGKPRKLADFDPAAPTTKARR